ncbi:hypothetical protein ADJ70_05445 [Olsenella sp. oral taxon 807]|uniref:hypothetical protein n=1 Tax=Olsenella sp. oral taxon 807 TaxID=712411 RepID=UPI00067A2E11|nr:hypothetical protein [Olsenella sp. oral taxon 807]AKT48520.1 hypothetical protein ADJ70_05445 [Olsenella sp. oral taxon 807]
MRYPMVTLLVRTRVRIFPDRLGNDRWELSAPVRVPGCLWAPGAPADLGADRPEGASVTATAHLPRGHGLSLRGGRVSLDGRDWLDVVGDPRPYPPGTVRGPWDTRVELGRQDG